MDHHGFYLRSLCLPSPERKWSLLPNARERPLVALQWSIVKSDLEQDHLDTHHDHSLNEKCVIITSPRPVE